MRTLTKVALGMAASYMLFSKPKRDFSEFTHEISKLPALLLGKTLKLTFIGFAFTLLAVGGIVMFFYDIGFFYNTHGVFGISSIGVSSLVLVLLSVGIMFALLRPKKFSPAREQHSSIVGQLASLISERKNQNPRHTMRHPDL